MALTVILSLYWLKYLSVASRHLKCFYKLTEEMQGLMKFRLSSILVINAFVLKRLMHVASSECMCIYIYIV